MFALKPIEFHDDDNTSATLEVMFNRLITLCKIRESDERESAEEKRFYQSLIDNVQNDAESE